MSGGGTFVGIGTGREIAAPADVSVDVLLLLLEPTTISVALFVAVWSSTTNVDEPAPISIDEPRPRVLLSIIYWDPDSAMYVLPLGVGLTVEVEVAELSAISLWVAELAVDALLPLVSAGVVMLSADF